ncbi:ankyrin repeat protein [Moumouvirus australiensis]|uniref:Ankyrin repeat protein n=1 Tax=Moumouvirus australiensis TaxID=2109587 RepID=A0A2P1EMR2_9VIRU|nr:ankyrin repeat protein [Moumouvirus australiensis]AVL95171.1 ankyrin repeat protein [Moumouvirus australiensis]
MNTLCVNEQFIELLRAANSGDFLGLKRFIKINIDMIGINNRVGKETPLTLATWWNNLKLIKLLIKFGADINIPENENGWSPLIIACIRHTVNSYEIIEYLLKNGADINHQDIKGRTALFKTCELYLGSRTHIVELLLRHNAYPDIRDNNGDTALIITSKTLNNNPNTKKLLEYGANYSIKNKFGKGFLDYPTEFQHLLEQQIYTRLCAKKVFQHIVGTGKKRYMNPDSLIIKIKTMKWYLDRNNLNAVVTFSNLDLFDYFGIYDLESLNLKIEDNLKHI